MRLSLPSKRSICISVLLFLVPGATCFPQTRVEEEFSAKVSKTRLLGQVQELVRLGSRTGGTASGDMSASYAVRKFKQAGFKPVIQNDPLRLAFDLKRWSLRVTEPPDLRRLIKHEWVGAYSPSVPDSKSELLYVQDPQKLSKPNVTGKAVLVDNPVSTKVYRAMAENGASCLLVTSPVLQRAYSDWAMITDLPPTKNNPIPLFNVSVNNARELQKALRDSQTVMIRFSTETSIDSARPKTVIATLEGESEKYYLICAHGDSDSGGPGADDNASGVSGVLEAARILKDLVVSRRIPKPKFSVRFV
ncbi:M28 family peptidase, partial [bacterium]